LDILLDARKNIETLRQKNPLVLNITNLVVTNITANALLAVGASPVMAFAKEEIEDMVSIAQAVVINIGTLTKDFVDAMFLAINKANTLGIPVIFDPVGAGATRYRNEISSKIMEEFKIDILRGNASEIANIAGEKIKTKGVDSTEGVDNIVQLAKSAATKYGCTVCVSGKNDIVTNADETYSISNGDIALTKITGSGCISTAIIGAYAAVDRNFISSCVTAALIVGISGEKAAKASKGLGSFQVNFFDNLSNVSEKFIDSAKIEQAE